MSDTTNIDFFNQTTLPAIFSDMSPDKLQALSSVLLEASVEAQGLISDMMAASATRPMSPQRPDPFGAMETQAKVGAALARDPEKVSHAMVSWMQGWMELFQSMTTGGAALPPDRRFSDPEWTTNPAFDFMRRAWMLNSQWLSSLIDAASPQLDEPTRAKAQFFVSQLADAMAPTNLPATNPAALRALADSGGKSVIEGLRNARRDLARGKGRLSLAQTDETAFRVGENVATADGKVIYRKVDEIDPLELKKAIVDHLGRTYASR